MAQFETILALISAAGAFGIAAYGVVEALGKALAWRGGFWDDWLKVPQKRRQPFGLPFVGFKSVQALALKLAPALRRTYGDDYLDILLQQYREARGKGAAPATLKQGVLLALPFMPKNEVQHIISQVWGLDGAGSGVDSSPYAARLAGALVDEKSADAPEATPQDEALASRFAVALEVRVQAAFAVAEERYGAILRVWAGATAIAMAVTFNFITGNSIQGLLQASLPDMRMLNEPWAGPLTAAMFGAVAVPLAPVANDLVSALSQAMKAWRDASVVKRGV